MDSCAWCKDSLTEANPQYDGIYENHGYLYCNKMCRKEHEDTLIKEGKVKGLDREGLPYASKGDDLYNGHYPDLDWNGVTITGGKKQLIEECKKRGYLAKSLMKPRSRGRGYEMRGDPHPELE